MRIYIFSGEGSSFAIISQLRIPLTVFFLLSLFSLPIDYTRLRMWEIRIRKFGRVFLFRTSPLPLRPLEIIEVCYYSSGESNKRPSSNSRDARIRWNHVSLAFSAVILSREEDERVFFFFEIASLYISSKNDGFFFWKRVSFPFIFTIFRIMYFLMKVN